ncbi:MAG: gliding motility protein GldL [Bacteroidales bacterium]|nr:gliding motility protein GldL [Bacteroidales bacterium]
MDKIKRYKNVVERFLSGENGQRFFNIAYSIGAAIVILGALFKILHLRGGDILLSLGMGTEVMMFILTAFDRPPRETSIEDIIPLLSGGASVQENGESIAADTTTHASSPVLPTSNSDSNHQGKSAIVSGGVSSPVIVSGGSPVTPEVAQELERLRETAAKLNAAGEALLNSYSSISTDPKAAAEGAAGYVEQMQALNRNIQGLNTIYEIQLRSVSSQLDAIQSVNSGMSQMKDMYQQTAECSQAYREEAQKLTKNMQQLNKVYEQMLNAMTVNMFNATSRPASND